MWRPTADAWVTVGSRLAIMICRLAKSDRPLSGLLRKPPLSHQEWGRGNANRRSCALARLGSLAPTGGEVAAKAAGEGA